jgi:hypothetical protein
MEFAKLRLDAFLNSIYLTVARGAWRRADGQQVQRYTVKRGRIQVDLFVSLIHRRTSERSPCHVHGLRCRWIELPVHLHAPKCHVQ